MLVQDNFGSSPLHLACISGNLAAVELQVRLAGPGAGDTAGRTPLHWAVVSGQAGTRLAEPPHLL